MSNGISFSWKQLAIGLIVLIIIPIVGVLYHGLIKADDKNATAIERNTKADKECYNRLDEKKVDNKTMQIQIQSQQLMIQVLQKQIESNDKKFDKMANEIKEIKRGN